MKKILFVWVVFLFFNIENVNAQPVLLLKNTVSDSTFQNNIITIQPYFSTLQNTKITVVFAKQKTPFTAAPSAFNFFRRKKNWHYTIKVSNGDSSELSSIFYRNLNTQAQCGVLAHEFSHVVDFETHTRLYLLKVLMAHLVSKKLDAFEYNTDKIALDAGAYQYLLAWKKDVEAKLDLTIFNRKRKNKKNTKRYMTAQEVQAYYLIIKK